MYEALRRELRLEELHEITKVKAYFIEQMKELVSEEEAARKGRSAVGRAFYRCKKGRFLRQVLKPDPCGFRGCYP